MTDNNNLYDCPYCRESFQAHLLLAHQEVCMARKMFYAGLGIGMCRAMARIKKSLLRGVFRAFCKTGLSTQIAGLLKGRIEQYWNQDDHLTKDLRLEYNRNLSTQDQIWVKSFFGTTCMPKLLSKRAKSPKKPRRLCVYKGGSIFWKIFLPHHIVDNIGIKNSFIVPYDAYYQTGDRIFLGRLTVLNGKVRSIKGGKFCQILEVSTLHINRGFVLLFVKET